MWFKSSTDIDTLIFKGKLEKAEKLLRTELENEPKNHRLRQKLADVLGRSGRLREAVAVLASLVHELADQGHALKAIAVIKKIERLDPERSDIDQLIRKVEARAYDPTPANGATSGLDTTGFWAFDDPRYERSGSEIGYPTHSGPASGVGTGSMPAVATGSMPAVATGSMPAVATGSMPAVATGAMPAVAAESVNGGRSPALAAAPLASPALSRDGSVSAAAGNGAARANAVGTAKAVPEATSKLDKDWLQKATVRSDFHWSPVLAHLSPEQLASSIGSSTLITKHAGSIIYGKGDPADSLFVLATGFVRAFERDSGPYRQSDVLEEGQFFGEEAFFDPDGGRKTTMTAALDCELLELDLGTLRELLMQNHDLMDRLEGAYRARTWTEDGRVF